MLATLAAFAGQAAVIYKWTDSGGLVHYSDQPVPGAEKIFTASSPAGASSASHAIAQPQGPGVQKPAEPGLGYSILAVTAPSPDQTFFGDEVIGVALAIEPGLKPNHFITWHLNGKQLDDHGPTTTQFALQSLDRGAYAIAATVTDQQTGESQSTGSVNFFVRQPSALAPLHQKP